MLRPEQMSKISVTGSKGVMPAVIEAIHELNLVHLSDYDGTWEGFENGNPMEGADDVSEKLVTVRALESTLDLSADDVAPGTLVDDWEDQLERVRTRVNELDDERNEVREQLRQVEERLDRVGPFAELGIDLDLLSGYENVDVLVGEGAPEEVDAVLEDAEEIGAYETFTGGDIVAIVASPADDTDPTGIIDDALVGIEFNRYAVPDTEKSPQEYVSELEERKASLEDEIDEIDTELGEIKVEEGGFLLRIEEELRIEAQRADAPLQFATTRRAFIAEGWIPSGEYDELVASLNDAVGDSVEIEELERAEYDRHGAPTHSAPVPAEESGVVGGEEDADETAAEEDGEKPKAATDGGTTTHGDEAVTMDEDPPVVLDNLTPAKPFEMMVQMVSQPKYRELDPTLLVFLTFPAAFGFMIGDIGYGILYMAMGWACWKFFDSDAMSAIGSIAVWAGGFTILFGYLFDDIFGVHMADLGLYLPLAGSLSKGIQTVEWVLLWAVVSVIFGLVHLNLGLIIGFINELDHGLKAAIFEKFSWILALNGLFIWIFSHQDAGSLGLGTDLTAAEYKPPFLVGSGEEAVLHSSDYFMDLGFAGFPELVGLIGLFAFLVGFVMVAMGEGIAGVAETPAWAFGHVLSYLRIVAVLLAKGVMAFVVNLLVFGAYEAPDGYMYFDIPGVGAETVAGTGDLSQQFVGLVHLGDGIALSALGIVLGIVVFVVGHIVVLLLGITAAGIQMLRLEYVEFFQKFYEGGGEEYEPFGDDRTHTDRTHTAD